MDWVDILGTVIKAVSTSETMVRGLLRSFGKEEEAEPYLSLGYVGLRYCREVIGNADNPDRIKTILTQSPSELWRNAQDVELENKLIRAAQLRVIGAH